MDLQTLNTPAALIDVGRMHRNIAHMQTHLDALGVTFRPHVKTTKCGHVVDAQIAAGAQGITVSTLKEAGQFFAGGVRDIVYAVGMVPAKLGQALALRRQGCDLKIVADSLQAAHAIAAFGREHGERFDVWIEVDVDGHRSGIPPEAGLLIDVGRALVDGGWCSAGARPRGLQLRIRHARRAGCDRRTGAQPHRAGRGAPEAAGLPCPVVSIGSTPTALSAQHLDGVTEVRAGVYVMFDLVMHNIGVCDTSDIALSVLTTVIGHQEEKGWAIVDAGWMAMSRDRGTQRQAHDFGYGQVCTEAGDLLGDYVMSAANQEHGIVSRTGSPDTGIAQRFPIGTRLRILPNHACATGAQHPEYQAIGEDGTAQTWPRFYGW